MHVIQEKPKGLSREQVEYRIEIAYESAGLDSYEHINHWVEYGTKKDTMRANFTGLDKSQKRKVLKNFFAPSAALRRRYGFPPFPEWESVLRFISRYDADDQEREFNRLLEKVQQGKDIPGQIARYAGRVAI